MLKKLTIALTCLFLVACQTSNNAKQTKQMSNESKDNGNLVMKALYNGDGNEQGFYHIATQEVNGMCYYNIYYDDYASKKEIFLCDKPECTHTDDSCTSLIQGSMLDVLFLHKDHLYLIQNEFTGTVFHGDGSMQQKEMSGPRIIQMDLDGKNKKILGTLPNGFSYQDKDIILDDHYLYLPLIKEETVEVSSSVYMSVAKEAKLFRIDLATGEFYEQLDFKNMHLIGCKNRTMILSKYEYQKDPDQLLQEKKYDEYNDIMRNATSTYMVYSPDSQNIQNEIKVDSSILCISDGTYLYYDANNEIHRVSLKDGKDEMIQTMPNDSLYGIFEYRDGHLIIHGWGKEETSASYNRSYAFSVKDLSLKELSLSKHDPKEPIEILAETKDSFFVYYDHDQHMEKTWAGTDQYELDKAYYGMISKEDFWNSNTNYQPLTTIHTR